VTTRTGGRWLLDGCLSAPLPVDVAIKEGADLILAMGFESPYPRRIKSATRYAFQLNSIYTNNLLRANFAFHNLAHHTEILPILPEFDGNYPVVGSWIVGDEPCGMGIREDSTPVTRNTSRFIPHYFD
jgi:predicted acylesterase/phospholipase RssA